MEQSAFWQASSSSSTGNYSLSELLSTPSPITLWTAASSSSDIPQNTSLSDDTTEDDEELVRLWLQ